MQTIGKTPLKSLWGSHQTSPKRTTTIKKVRKVGQSLLEAVPRVFPVRTDWAMIQSCKQKRDESVADFWFCLEEIFREHFGLWDCEADGALSARFVNGLLPELHDLLKKQMKTGDPPLSELQHLAERFERILEQKQGCQTNNLMTPPLQRLWGRWPDLRANLVPALLTRVLSRL